MGESYRIFPSMEHGLEGLCNAAAMPKRSEGVPEEYADSRRALGSTIGGRIRARRRQLDLSQDRLRAQMELENVYISRTQFSRIEAGESLPDAAEIIALAKVLQVSCHWLLGTHEERYALPDHSV